MPTHHSIDCTATPALSDAYKGRGLYLVAHYREAVPAIEHCLSASERSEWVPARYYRGRPTRESRAKIETSRATAWREMAAQVTEFLARHPGAAEITVGYGSCTEIAYITGGETCPLAICAAGDDGPSDLWWHVHGRQREQVGACPPRAQDQPQTGD